MLENAFNLLIKLQSRPVTIERISGSSELVRGIIPATSLTLISDISEGLAFIAGLPVVIPTTTVTYTASKDTYIDLSSAGVITYVVVANAATAPAITAGDIRIAKVVTDLTTVASVTMLRTPKETYSILPLHIRVSPSNYSRNLTAPEETIITGREFIISKRALDAVNFPSPRRGDRLKDPATGTDTITDIREMYDFGGAIMGYRVRTS